MLVVYVQPVDWCNPLLLFHDTVFTADEVLQLFFRLLRYGSRLIPVPNDHCPWHEVRSTTFSSLLELLYWLHQSVKHHRGGSAHKTDCKTSGCTECAYRRWPPKATQHSTRSTLPQQTHTNTTSLTHTANTYLQHIALTHSNNHGSHTALSAQFLCSNATPAGSPPRSSNTTSTLSCPTGDSHCRGTWYSLRLASSQSYLHLSGP